jgi:hypothetical protein
MLKAMNYLPQGYLAAVSGGEYKDTIVLLDSTLPDNNKSLRVGLATELLHQKLVDLQYEE